MSSGTEIRQADVFERIAASDEFRRLFDEIRRGSPIVSLTGLTSGAAKACVLAALQKETGKTFVVVSETNKDLEDWNGDLCFFSQSFIVRRSLQEKSNSEQRTTNNEQILILPSSDADPYAGVSPHAETLEQRALTLWRLIKNAPDFLLLTARALVAKTVAPEELRNLGAYLRREEDFPPEELIEKLVACGYVREEPVAGVGQFSSRGGIVDVWSPDCELPVRVEFWGDTVDSIREFDPETQLSTRQLKEISFAPMREFAALPQDFRDWAFFARERFSDERFARALADRTQFADEGESFSGWEFLLPVLHERKGAAFDYLPKDSVLIFDEPASVEKYLGSFYQNLENSFEETNRADELGLPPNDLFLTPDELRERVGEKQRLELRALGRAAAATDESLAFENENPQIKIPDIKSQTAKPLFLFSTAEKAAEIEIISRSARRYHNRISELASDLKRSQQRTMSSEQRTIFVLQTSGMRERVSELLRESEVNLPSDSFALGNLSSGFELPVANLIVHTEADLFDEIEKYQVHPEFQAQQQRNKAEKQKSKGKSQKDRTGAFLSDFRDLKPGDFVVHVDHGIGRFEGLNALQMGEQSGEFMLVTYADNAKLYVPVERLDLVSRFSSAEAQQPNLDKLGGIGWQAKKAKAKRAMRDMADELLRLYAERKLVQGYAFAADSPWQDEFENAFPYELTIDQAASVEDVKKDMEATTPMDRLLCGDVGFGKTEVAMRAAFKAAMDSKQVAVLTPTTVLAYQHYETFKKRFAAFPITVELLSRFRSPKEQKEAVKKLESGAVDIIIGTHRILSKDVVIPNLGLVVVDEEQRFGVAHKERLKQLKKKVDVLTLSATPIPRTLNMALTGMRDMSVIETAPRDRLAINTQVVQFSDSVIKSAIELEMSRQGQVFFIHNRVETIQSIAALIKKIVPEARIIVAHGQMNEQEMETAMLDFVDYKFDVLVATTIIENGIDIPRANTIIINRADNYGLSQLYQLRGRVGRSNRRAYAYLLIPGELTLTPIARRRLSAIREFSDLGAGFRIAALDLELRGAGNMLGGEQSGHLDALGFDLYTRMLERTVAEIRGDEIEDEASVSINLGVDVSIPTDYIADMSQRLRTYKRISSANSEEVLNKLFAEIQDRYGRAPESVENLFNYAKLRRLAEEMRVLSIDKTPQGIAFKLSERAMVEPEKLMDLVNSGEGIGFSPNGVLRIPINSADESQQILDSARQILHEIRSNG
ncbi:MAG TPA: transcription-repair coupling factor [Pyrinomonadaceae bacterium]|jgi:transcription-repair coupling factor (superfamily II helicase)